MTGPTFAPVREGGLRLERGGSILLLLSASLASAACGGAGGPPAEDVLPPDVLEAVAAGNHTVIVLLGGTRATRGLAAGVGDPGDREVDRDAFAVLKEAFRSGLDARELEGAVDHLELPMMTVHARSEEALYRLAAAPAVERLFPNEAHEPSLGQSLGVIDQAGAAAAGATGAGATVAVLDTGVDYTRAAFGSCGSAGAPGCAVTTAIDFAPDDASRDDNGHGTNVAAIVLGVAPGARIAALDVFRSDGYGYTTDIIAAIDWSIANRAALGIEAMNLSLGSGGSTSVCGSNVFATPLALARSAGIVPVVASGNNGYTDRISSPACVPAALSVGAVYDSSMGGIGWSGCTDVSTSVDRVTCFSNSASFLTMLAPGALIVAGGHTMGGTSQAAPHVAGAVAVVRAAYPGETPDETTARLVQAGVSVTDHRNGVQKPRLALGAAVEGAPDLGAPEGTIVIDGGAAATRAGSVTLTLDATDDVGVTEMCLSNTSTCRSWIAYSPTRSWSLTSRDGTKTVYATFRDALGNQSEQVSATIVRDAAAPRNGVLSATRSDGAISISWSGFTDAASAIVSHRISYAVGSAPSSCSAGTSLSTDATSPFEHSGLTNGTRYGYRVCAVDAAGNVSTGATVTATPVPETNAPEGTVTINGGALLTGSTAVTLTLSATDETAVSGVCVSSAASCSRWVTFAESVPFTLSSGSGLKTVNVWFRDSWLNGSASAISATITLDTTRPTNGTASVSAGDGTSDLAWSGFTDLNGITEYRVAYQATRAPSSCAAGTLLYSGTETSATHDGAVNGTEYFYRVCAVDAAGNVSTGAVASGIPAPERNPPSGTVSIDAGALYARSSAVTLELSATDDTAVGTMCISNTTTCTAWVPYATSRAFSLASGAGTKTVYVRFRDTWGNAMASPVTDTIDVDATRPASGTLVAVAAAGAVELSWSGQTDAGGSGLASYKLVYRAGTPPTSCSSGTILYEGTAVSATHSGASSGVSYGYRLCTIDGVGNMSAGATTTARPG